jgi:hypothetical protein
VLICIGNGCRCAVSPASISSHLRRKHHVRIELRKQVDRYIEGFPFQYDHSNVRLPPDGLAPQPIIRINDGFECHDCKYKTQDRSNIKKHGNKEHGKKRAKDEDLFDRVRLQSWFGNGKERYWVVDESKRPVQAGQQGQSASIGGADELDDGDDDGENGSRDDSDGQEEVDDQIIRDIEHWKAEAKERRLTLLKKAPVDEADPWFRYNQWNEVLSQSKHNIMKTHHFTREPDAEEPELTRVLRAWSRILERCLDTLAASNHRDTLKWWASPKNEAASQQPFELPQSSKTIDKYSGLYQHFLCYAMRTAPAEWGDESETGVIYTERQLSMINEIRAILQTEPPGDEYTDEREQDQELTTALMRFCMAVVMQDMSKITVYDSPLMHFLAVMGVDTATRALRPSFFYTPILAGVLYINRLIMLEVAVPVEAWPMLKSRDEIQSVPERIEEIRKKHLCEGSFSPTSSILSQLAMGKSFNKLHKSAPNIHWSEDEQTIFWAGEGVALQKVRVMCQELNRELREMLDELMFGPMPGIDLSQIVDSMAWSNEFRRDDYSFIQHPKNKGIVDTGYQALLRRARKASGERQMMKKGVDGQDEWIDHRVNAYLAREKQFLRKAMATTHVQYGQPARGPELGCMKVSNSIYSARNTYVINGRLCFLSTYDKARKRRGNIEYIVRFLPDELSQVIVQYLVRVRPFTRALDRRESEYLFGDLRGPWAGEELTRVLGPTTEKHLGVRLTTSVWRQVAVGVATRHLIRASKTWEKDDEAIDGDPFAEGDDEQELEEATFQHIMIRQAGHGTRVAQNHYAVDAEFLHRLGPELLSVYERASIAWHELFELRSEGASRWKGLTHRREASQQIVSGLEKKAKVKQEGSLPVTKAIIGLRKIFGPAAKPRSEGQAAALELVHQPPPTSIIVLPTSSGKSALFFSIAAIAEQQTVIVVVPFTALVDDIIDRGQKAGLHCEEWLGPDSCGELQQLVVVGADRAVSEGFGHYAKGLELNQQLAHMFFDECHVAFTDTSYRERLRELWKLRYMDCPFTCLTATLIVQLEDVLRDQLLIPKAQLFRRSTARRTIRYNVQDSGDEAPSVFGLKVIQSLVLPAGKRGVIYVRSYATGEMISGALKCPFYKARADDKGELLREWMRGCGWIVATGALGTGINIEDIVFVVHVDRPYGLTSFAQQSGRGGRGGEVSDSIVVVRVKTTGGRRRKEILSEYCVEQVDEDAMTEFLQVEGCRRQVIAKYFDGEPEGVDCRSTDSILCDWCKVSLRRPGVAGYQHKERGGEVDSTAEEGASNEVRGSEMIAGRLKELVEADELVFQVMDILKGGCVYCEFIPIHGGAGEEPHTYAECSPAEANDVGYCNFRKWRENVEFGKEFMHCFNCGLTQKMCRKQETGEACEYRDVMLAGIYILHEKGFLISAVQGVGFQGDYPADLWEWMKQEGEGFGSVIESNWMKTWRQVCIIYLRMRKEYRGK